jgi:hypothetical protein
MLLSSTTVDDMGYNSPYKIVSFKVMGIEQIDRFALEEEQLDLRWAREYLSKFALQR